MRSEGKCNNYICDICKLCERTDDKTAGQSVNIEIELTGMKT